MAKDLKIVERYNGYDIKHSVFFNQYMVFIPVHPFSENKEMYRFDTLEETKGFLDKVAPTNWMMRYL